MSQFSRACPCDGLPLKVLGIMLALASVRPAEADERKADSKFVKHVHIRKDGHYEKKKNDKPPGNHGASSDFPDCRFYPYEGANTPKDGMTWAEEWRVTAALADRARQGAAPGGGSVEVLDLATCRYNCFSFVLAGWGQPWYETDSSEQFFILLTQSHTVVTGPAMVGDICVWGPSSDKLPVHAGRVIEVKGGKATRIRSKWGHGPLMDHPPESAAAMYGAAVGYFRKKPTGKK